MQLYLNRNMFIFDKIETPSLVFKCMARVFYTSYIQMCITMYNFCLCYQMILELITKPLFKNVISWISC